MNVFKRLFGTSERSGSSAARTNLPRIELAWRDDTTMPIPDWKAAWRLAPSDSDDEAQERFWWSAASTWLDALRINLREGFTVESSKSFMLLSTLDQQRLKLTLEFCERTRARILRALDGVASSWGRGPHVVLVFDNIDQYYDYVGNYYPKAGVFGMSSGMFIQHGYGHFVFVASDMYAMEPVIAHELTHCLLAPLPIPAWLNEGTAVSIEKQLVPLAVDPRRGIFMHREEAAKRAAFWNAQTIQEFWSGKSFKRPDEGSALSYELAEQLTKLIARNYAQYRAYMNAAHRNDGGLEAARPILGYSLAELAAAVLGDGRWAPDPSKWSDGTERGQF
jgi:hypothetical protein